MTSRHPPFFSTWSVLPLCRLELRSSCRTRPSHVAVHFFEKRTDARRCGGTSRAPRREARRAPAPLNQNASSLPHPRPVRNFTAFGESPSVAEIAAAYEHFAQQQYDHQRHQIWIGIAINRQQLASIFEHSRRLYADCT